MVNSFASVIVSSGKPGRHPDGINYNWVIRRAVSRKWTTPEQKEWWYTKFTVARRRKTRRLYNQQNGQCCFCKRQTWMSDTDKGSLTNNRKATLEHVYPQGQGGTDHMSNLVMSCLGCNNLRGDMKFHKFMKLRSDPEAWRVFCKMIAAAQNLRKREVKSKRDGRRVEIMWNLAFLMFLQPQWIEVVDSYRVEFLRRRHAADDRHERRVANSPLDPEDIT